MQTGRSARDITALLSYAVFLIRLFGDPIQSVISPKPTTLLPVLPQPVFSSCHDQAVITHPPPFS